MHYCWTLYTNEKPSKEKIEEILKPYKMDDDGNTDERPLKWDFYLIGGRYCGTLKSKIPEPDIDDEAYFLDTIEKFYQTLTYGKDEAVNQMMYADLPHPLAKNKYFDTLWASYSYLGWLDGYMRCDGAPVKSVMNELDDLGYGFITESGDIVNGNMPGYVDKCLDTIEKYKNGYVTLLDLHS